MTLLALAATFLAAGCTGRSVDPAVHDAQLKRTTEIYEAMQNRFDRCVETSAKMHLANDSDKSAAVEYGFAACATEGRAISDTLSADIAPGIGVRLLDQHKLELKEQLVESL